MSEPVDADRNLLFGVLALQQDLIDTRQFADACAGWAVAKDRPLADILVERGWLTAADRAEVERFLERKLRRHGGDARASLAAAAGTAARDALRGVDDPVVRGTLSDLPPAAGYVLTESLVKRDETRSRYTLTRLHARGGLGQVWLARDADLNREVALKEIKPGVATHPEMWRRFLKEAQVTGQLEHPNIVPVYELARRPGDGQPFYTMRFVRGRTLREAVAEHHARLREGKAETVERLRLLQAFVAVCQAIGYAHSRGVIHRDLKPDNVVLGGFGEVIVLDWGLARATDQPDEADEPPVALSEEAQASATQPGRQIGTPAYMAPEQADGRVDRIDARTDVYGLGAVLFEILTGRPPHDGADSADLMRKIVVGPTPRARAAETAVPPALDAVCARAMALQPGDRYAKAADLADDVQRWLADEPVAAFPEGPRARAARWARRHRVWVQAGVAVLGVLMLAAVAVAVLQVQSARRLRAERDNTLREEKKVRAERDRAEKALAAEVLQRRRAESAEAAARQTLTVSLHARARESINLGDVTAGQLLLSEALAASPPSQAAWQEPVRRSLGDWSRVNPLVAALPTGGGTYHCVFSRDGRLAATAGRGRSARVWSTADGSPVGPPIEFRGFVNGVAFSPDGRRIAIGTLSRAFQVFEVGTSQPVCAMKTLPRYVNHVCYSPDGRLILTACGDGNAQLWSADTVEPVGEPLKHGNELSAAVFTPDGRLVVTVGENEVRLWTTADRRPHLKPMAEPDRIFDWALSPDGRYLATGTLKPGASLWRVEDATLVGRTPPRNGHAKPLAFSPDSRTLAVGASDSDVVLHAVPDLGEQGPRPSPGESSLTAAFSPDGRLLLTGSQRFVKLWDVKTGAQVGRSVEHENLVGSAAFSPDGRLVLSGGPEGDARLWKVEHSPAPARVLPHPGEVLKVDVSRGGRVALTGGDGGARLWSLPGWETQGPPLDAGGPVDGVALAPDGSTAVTVNRKRQLHAWSTSDGKSLGPPVEVGLFDRPVFTPDGRTVLVADPRDHARFYSASDLSPAGPALGHPRTPRLAELFDSPTLAPNVPRNIVTTVALSPDGRFAATGGHDNAVRLWRLPSGEPVGLPFRHKGSVNSVAFSPDSRLAWSCDFHGTLVAVSTADATPVGPTVTQQNATVGLAAFSPDGRFAVTAVVLGPARLWRLADGTPVGKPFPCGLVRPVFSPDGNVLVTATDARDVRLWSTGDGSQVGRPLPTESTSSPMAFTPDGRQLLTGGARAGAYVWAVPSPLDVPAEAVRLHAQVLTGSELAEDGYTTRGLDARTWEERRAQLRRLTGRQ